MIPLPSDIPLPGLQLDKQPHSILKKTSMYRLVDSWKYITFMFCECIYNIHAGLSYKLSTFVHIETNYIMNEMNKLSYNRHNISNRNTNFKPLNRNLGGLLFLCPRPERSAGGI